MWILCLITACQLDSVIQFLVSFKRVTNYLVYFRQWFIAAKICHVCILKLILNWHWTEIEMKSFSIIFQWVYYIGFTFFTCHTTHFINTLKHGNERLTKMCPCEPILLSDEMYLRPIPSFGPRMKRWWPLFDWNRWVHHRFRLLQLHVALVFKPILQ